MGMAFQENALASVPPHPSARVQVHRLRASADSIGATSGSQNFDFASDLPCVVCFLFVRRHLRFFVIVCIFSSVDRARELCPFLFSQLRLNLDAKL